MTAFTTNKESPEKNLEVFDRPLCCSTGICGARVDPALVHFADDLAWLKTQGIEVRRYNLPHEPAAFTQFADVKEALRIGQMQCLPMVRIDGRIVNQGNYPSRDQLADWCGVDAEPAAEEAEKSCCFPTCCTERRRARRTHRPPATPARGSRRGSAPPSASAAIRPSWPRAPSGSDLAIRPRSPRAWGDWRCRLIKGASGIAFRVGDAIQLAIWAIYQTKKIVRALRLRIDWTGVNCFADYKVGVPGIVLRRCLFHGRLVLHSRSYDAACPDCSAMRPSPDSRSVRCLYWHPPVGRRSQCNRCP